MITFRQSWPKNHRARRRAQGSNATIFWNIYVQNAPGRAIQC
jgi:hypothetical protein